MTWDIDSLNRVIGILGVGFYLLSYGLLQAGVLRSSGYAYSVLNLLAASLVLASLIEAFNLASAVIQIAWILISIVGIVRIFLTTHRIAFSPEERALIAAELPDMPSAHARSLLDAGLWTEAEAGMVLTVEGAPVDHLRYLDGATARVTAGGHVVAHVERGLVGEMNVLEAGPASATVEIVRPGRIFTVSGDALRRLAARDSEFRLHLERRLSASTRRKLLSANRALAAAREAG